MPGNYIQVGGKKRTVKFSESNVTRDEQGRFAKKGSGKGKGKGKGVTNKGLLSKQERLRLSPNSTLQGAAIKAIPGESLSSQSKRARKAAAKFNRQIGGNR